MKKILILLCCAFFVQFSLAQSALDSAKNELYRINKSFDSSRYISFDLEIFYKSDSATKTVETDELSGNYVLNKKNVYYSMGNSEYVQTDSFSYNIYNDEKLMIMTKNFDNGNSNLFPVRTFVDSAVLYYHSFYNISADTLTNDTLGFVRKINFLKNGSAGDSVAPYNYFTIYYRPESYFPVKFEFAYKDNFTPIDTLPSYTYKVTKTITMNFSNFKAFSNTAIFDDIQYIRYNRQRKIYEPSVKYKEYRFVTSGIDNEDEEAAYYKEAPDNGN